jgi:hypothetical protein
MDFCGESCTGGNPQQFGAAPVACAQAPPEPTLAASPAAKPKRDVILMDSPVLRLFAPVGRLRTMLPTARPLGNVARIAPITLEVWTSPQTGATKMCSCRSEESSDVRTYPN